MATSHGALAAVNSDRARPTPNTSACPGRPRETNHNYRVFHGDAFLNTVAPKSGLAAGFSADETSALGGSLRKDVHTRRMFEISFCDVIFDDFVELIDEQVAMRRPGFIVTPNVDHICRFHRDAAFRAAYENARLVLCDGMPIVWVSKLLARPLRQKLSGSDLIYWLSGHAAERGYSVYFFGARDGIAAETADRLKQRFPALKVAGTQSPVFGFHSDPDTNAEATKLIRDSKADIVFIALGSPKQEIWMNENVDACGAPVMIGVGAAFDFVSGRVKRAPEWMQRTGMEWIWRLCLEPRRLWRRYLVEDALILKLLAAELWAEYVLRKKGNAAAS